MTKEEAVAYMITKIEEIERDRLAAHLSIDPTQKKKEAVNKILKELEGVTIDNENQQD